MEKHRKIQGIEIKAVELELVIDNDEIVEIVQIVERIVNH